MVRAGGGSSRTMVREVRARLMASRGSALAIVTPAAPAQRDGGRVARKIDGQGRFARSSRSEAVEVSVNVVAPPRPPAAQLVWMPRGW